MFCEVKESQLPGIRSIVAHKSVGTAALTSQFRVRRDLGQHMPVVPKRLRRVHASVWRLRL
jgi:hypothetical protein